MLLPTLVSATLIRRYKRFLADVVLPSGSEVVTVHCPNPGRMLGLDTSGARVWLSHSVNPKRALPYTLELVEADGELVGINTMRPNRLVEEAILSETLPSLRGYTGLRREVAYDHSCRVDLLLDGPSRPDCYVEVKNVHLRRSGPAEFPDCVTARGVRHLQALSRRVAAGERAVVVYVVQRMDCTDFVLASDIDPAYAAASEMARASGVEMVCCRCRVALDEIRVDGLLPFRT